MNFRRLLFYLFDKLRGSQISKDLNHIRDHFDFGKYDNSLEKLLLHTRTTVPIYSQIKASGIVDFPVVNKTIIKNNVDKHISTKVKDQNLVSMTTSGSTGTPFTVYQDIRKKNRNYADTLYFGKLAGYTLGNRNLYLKIWAKEKMLSKWHYTLQNVVPIDVIKLDNNQIEDLIINIEENVNQQYSVLGYVSALEQLIRYFEEKDRNYINATFTSVITMSESLSDVTKEKLQIIFRCPVVSRYSNLENGIIAQQEVNGKKRFLINTASYLVEVLNFKNNESAEPGELGRIVVTDLYNYAMPMIRYDTGDVGAIEFDPAEPKKLFLSLVEGRKLDLLFDTKGNLVSSYIAYKNMWQYPEISQYQFIQESEKTYRIKVNCKSKFTKEEKLLKELMKYLGDDAQITVEYTTEIPLLASGKRRKIVNLYKNNTSDV